MLLNVKCVSYSKCVRCIICVSPLKDNDPILLPYTRTLPCDILPVWCPRGRLHALQYALSTRPGFLMCNHKHFYSSNVFMVWECGFLSFTM